MSTPCRAEFLAGLRIMVLKPPPLHDVTRRAGSAVSLEEWRARMLQNRAAVLEQHGVYWDGSPTGAGKSHADIQAAQSANRSLVVMPTHDNASEVELDMNAAGLEAMKYPGRYTEDKTPLCPRCDRKGKVAGCPLCGGDGKLLIEKNCENDLADLAEGWGLSVVAAVCPTCPDRSVCRKQGYLAGVSEASQARVSIATHARAKYAGLPGLGEGREYQVIHEDALEIFRPMLTSSETDLAAAKKVVEILLTEPRWLNWFDEGEEEKERDRREQLYEFSHHMLTVACEIEDQARFAERTQRIRVPIPLAKPRGMEALLFQVAHENQAQFTHQPLRILLAVAAGEFFQVGVLVNGKPTQQIQTASDQIDRRRPGQPADEECQPGSL